MPRLVAMFAVMAVLSHPASAVETTGGPTLKLAMGPVSAAQKHQGVAEKSEDVVTKPHHRHIKHQRSHHRH